MEHHSNIRFGKAAQALHWITAIIVLIAFIYGPGGSELRVYAPSRDFERQLHESLGLCVFALTVLRVLWRTVDRQPDPQELSRWMKIASKTVQGVLYLLLFAVPLTAILGAWLEGHPLTLLAGVSISSPVGLSHDTGEKIASIHTLLGDTIIWLAGLHALAALYHHFVMKDGVLVSMLPRWLLPRETRAR